MDAILKEFWRPHNESGLILGEPSIFQIWIFWSVSSDLAANYSPEHAKKLQIIIKEDYTKNIKHQQCKFIKNNEMNYSTECNKG